MERTLYLIRHGDTEGTLRGLFYGSTDLPLDDSAYPTIEKKRTAGDYPERGDQLVFTSGMLRTEQTLEAIYGTTEHEIIRDLREIELGIFEMKTAKEVMQDPYGKAWLTGEAEGMNFPGGDRTETFTERVGRGLAVLRHRLEANDVIAVLHGGVIFTIMMMLFPGEKENAWEWTPEPAGGYRVLFRDGEPTEYTRI